jgi:hypothetical protein
MQKGAAMHLRALTLTALALVVATGASIRPSEARAEQPERAFFDLYGGLVHLFESDVPGWKLEDSSPTVGGRVGIWFGQSWGLTFRTWYFQTDAKLDDASPSDLAFLGLSLEVIGRWSLTDYWALYGTLGPMVAVTTLDRQRDSVTGIEDDSRSVAPGASVSAGTEVRVFKRLRAFAEVQGSAVYPEYEFQGRKSSPRLLTIHGLMGVRVPF